MATIFTADQLRVGMALRYKGDDIPFATPFLKNKGNKLGNWLLPSFTVNPAAPSGRKWEDLPGSKRDTYTITKIETGRKGKGGRPLEDLIHIVGEGYAPGTVFGLVPADVIAKFELVGDAVDMLDADKLPDEIKAHQAAILREAEWSRQLQLTEGW